MPFPPSAACRFLDLPPVNLQNLPLHLTKNAFSTAPTHLCGIAQSQGSRAPRERARPFLSAAYPQRPRLKKELTVEKTAAAMQTKWTGDTASGGGSPVRLVLNKGARTYSRGRALRLQQPTQPGFRLLSPCERPACSGGMPLLCPVRLPACRETHCFHADGSSDGGKAG